MGGNSPEAIIKVLNFLCTTKKVRALTQPLTQFSLDFQTIAIYIWGNGVKLLGELSVLPFAFFLLSPTPL